jgi:uncharacterized protein
LAATLPVAGLVLISGYTSLPDVGASVYPFIPVQLLMLDRFDNLGKIGRVAAPILILHGTADWTIPYDHATSPPVHVDTDQADGGQLCVSPWRSRHQV